ncbi:gamma-glutamyltransferase [Fangia hongkongensis]|nr:gamma-glutamyltransferase [Fangia hongkongensis]MBK2123821.1 gamma-glutamyltransferase [Fangia hongkongensis]
MWKIIKSLMLSGLLCSMLSQLLFSAEVLQEGDERFYPVETSSGVVASQEALASKAGAEILQQGGNAVDAAVATGFALAVTLPKAGNLGGGGFMVVWLNKEKKSIAINYREKAPLLASSDMYLNEKKEVDRNKISGTYLASGTPGTVAGLILAQKTYGKLSLAQVMAPAIKLAKEGFVMNYPLYLSLLEAKPWLSKSKASMAIFFKKDGSSYLPGERFKQPQLAWTLERIAKTNGKDFYHGEIAKRLAKDFKDNGGLITLKDLNSYKAEIVEPVKGNYKGYTVYSMPPPSSGGVILVELLNILENFPLKEYGANSAKAIHVMTEAMNYAYNDRNSDLGDPHFIKMDLSELLSKKYAASIAAKIDPKEHTPASAISKIKPDDLESNQTTQYSVVDKEGNMVSNTYTLNYSYGSGISANGLGFLLNNEMDDFTAKVGVANAYGLIQGEANNIAPGKQPLSSMTPTIVLNKEGEPYFATGSPGGSRIITTTLQVILNVLEYGYNLQTAVSLPRVHSQLWPDEIRIEQGISPDTIELLKKMGHKVSLLPAMGAAESVMLKNGHFYGAADPRRSGALAA